MSDVRKMRQELRQGLHQYLMQLYQSYLGTIGEDEAKAIVAEEVNKQYEFFLEVPLEQEKVISTLHKKRESIEATIESIVDYDTQLYYAEKLDALNTTIELLESNE